MYMYILDHEEPDQLHCVTNTSGTNKLCMYTASCRDGDVRLVNGSSNNEGHVEICFSGRWGTIQADEWFYDETNVACRQLGYSTEGTLAFL